MSFIDYGNIKAFVEHNINNIAALSSTDAALVAAMANMLDGRNNPPSNMAALLAYLQGREDLVNNFSTVKEVTKLLGASMPSKNTVWKMQEFLGSGVFTVPGNIAGNLVYVTGCGGGGCGGVQQWNPAIGASGSVLLGGAGGFWRVRIPVPVSALQSVPVTVGDGGAGVDINDFITSPTLNNGQDSLFGALSFAGGQASSVQGGFKPQRLARTVSGSGTTLLEPDSSGLFLAGSTQTSTVSGTNFYWAIGGACGLFGNGGNGAVDTTGSGNLTAQSALANTGAGGGAALRYTGGTTPVIVTSGAGGSGRIIVEWQEFV